MSKRKVKYRDIIGKRKFSYKNRIKSIFHKTALYKYDKKKKYKRKFDEFRIKNRKTFETYEKNSLQINSSESETEEHDLQRLRNTFSGNIMENALAIDSSDNDNENDESYVLGDKNISKNSHYKLRDNTSEDDGLSNENGNQESIIHENQPATEEKITVQNKDEQDNLKDPFIKHLFYELNESVLESLCNKPVFFEDYVVSWPQLGRLIFQIPKSVINENRNREVGILESKMYASQGELPKILDMSSLEIDDLFLKNQVVNSVKNHITKDSKNMLSFLQTEIFSIINNYQDLYYPGRTFCNAEEIRYVYCLHVANHILKTRIKVVHHNARLSKKDDVPEEFRDQGLVRPKVLIILPFKDAAYKTIQMLKDIILSEDKGNVNHKKRFINDYSGNELCLPKKNPKPEDYQLTFQGNTSDDFKIGITVTKKGLKLYADFYSSDIIVASPLGLRTVIGAEGEKERDYDFLASIELLIFDQTEIFLMQNWDHIFHILNHMHMQPKESHGTDFSRVRTWSLNGWAKYYRQTLIFSSLILPEINAVFNKKCLNYAGKVKVANFVENAYISQVVVQIPHVFHQFEAQNAREVMDGRFNFFINKVLPSQKDNLMKQTLIFIPNYFDYVRIRNYFKKEGIGFVQICEYSKEGKVARARDMFYHGDAHFLLYTERYHFFNRKYIKGIRHIVFYQPPNFPHFYYEMCNLIQTTNMNNKIGNPSNATVTVIYSKYDIHQLSSIIGTERAAKMIQSDRKVHMMITGAD